MKLIKYVLAVAALTTVLTLSAKADLMFLGAVDFNNGPNSPDANRAAFIASQGFDPGALSNNFENKLSGSFTVTPGEFFVVHFGKGKGGTGSGGSLEFFQVVGGETSVTFPQFGNVAGPDPFGHGGISSARGFGGGTPPHTPDGGATAALLGLGLAGLAGLRAKFGKN